MLYLDASAVVKLVLAEPESPSLVAEIESVGVPLYTSVIARVEVVRAVARNARELLPQALSVLRRYRFVALDRTLLDAAGTVGGPALRSLEAIHLASALQLGALLTGFLAYDRRLLDAAGALGLPTMSPGLDS